MSITILEVAGAADVHPDTASAALADLVEYDFRGLAVVDDAIARDYVAGVRAATRKHEAEQRAYRDYVADRGVRRMEVVHAHRVAARAAVLRRNRVALHSTTGPGLATGPVLHAGIGGSDIEYACREAEFNAGNAAWAEFDRREPEMTFDRWVAKHGKAIAEALAA